MNPIATIKMKNGSRIILELLPKAAPNAVNSFISLAKKGCYDNHLIERIVPGSWIDISYTAFRKIECQYLIQNDLERGSTEEHPKVEPGMVIMGGYGREQVSGGEFVFPLRRCEELDNMYPVFAKVKEGMNEIYRLEKIDTFPVEYKYDPNIKINCPIEPEIIESIVVDTYGIDYPEPIKLDVTKDQLPKAWFDQGYPNRK